MSVHGAIVTRATGRNHAGFAPSRPWMSIWQDCREGRRNRDPNRVPGARSWPALLARAGPPGGGPQLPRVATHLRPVSLGTYARALLRTYARASLRTYAVASPNLARPVGR